MFMPSVFTKMPNKELRISVLIGLSVLCFCPASCTTSRHKAISDNERDIDAIGSLLFARFLENSDVVFNDSLKANRTLVQEEPEFIDDNNIEVKNGLMIDSYGEPYRIRSSGDGYLIWTCGPNKTNEYGNGDDFIKSFPYDENQENLRGKKK